MPTPGEHKTVQARILAYAEAIGWTIVSREEAEQRRGVERMKDEGGRMKGGSLFFDDLLDARVREFNPRYAEAEGALLGQFRHLHTDIYGNREFVEHLRNRVRKRRLREFPETASRPGIPNPKRSNRRGRRKRKEDFDRAIWRQAVAKSSGRKFSRRLRENRQRAPHYFCNSLLEKLHIV